MQRTMLHAKLHRAEARTVAPRVVFVDHANGIADVGGDPAVVPDGSGLESSGMPRGPR